MTRHQKTHEGHGVGRAVHRHRTGPRGQDLHYTAAGLWLTPQVTLPVAETIVTIALGALLAADCPLSLAFVASLAILLGLLHGILNGSELPKTPSSGQLIAAGVAVALFVAVSILAGQAASVRVPWARVAVRVAGSWIVAIGLLMLGWAMRLPG
jgi:hydrogenase/urease accessory protein HupE